MGVNLPAPHIAVLGAGSWGTALAMQLDRAGCPTTLWGRDPLHLEDIQRSGSNERYLPGVAMPTAIQLQPDLEKAVTGCEQLLIVSPSHAFGEVLQQVSEWLPAGAGVAWAAKGFEPGSGRLLHEVAQSTLGNNPLAVVTGPSFAIEVAKDLPTAVTVAATEHDFGRLIATALHAGNFRTYYTDDIVGAELGGAVKNVMAIATGICDGMQLGDNARAALITRGLAEMMRVGRAMGARPETLMGLAGMGDLVLTCTCDKSRNRRLGLALGQGQTIRHALEEIDQVVEGVGAAEEVVRLAYAHDVEMPISEQVHGIIHKGWDPFEGVRRLLSREQKHETD